eukprot:scaffold24893_cov27-Tisochrysis_lutea.AAC.3
MEIERRFSISGWSALTSSAGDGSAGSSSIRRDSGEMECCGGPGRGVIGGTKPASSISWKIRLWVSSHSCRTPFELAAFRWRVEAQGQPTPHANRERRLQARCMGADDRAQDVAVGELTCHLSFSKRSGSA